MNSISEFEMKSRKEAVDFRHRLLVFARYLEARNPVIRRYGAEDIVQDVLLKTVTADRSFPTSYDKLRYYKTAVLNRVRDVSRSFYMRNTTNFKRGEFVEMQKGNSAGDVFANTTHSVRIEGVTNDIRVVLKRMSELQPDGNRVDYAAVLALYFRFTLAKRLIDAPGGISDLALSPALMVESVVVWTKADAHRKLRSGWPDNGMIWRKLIPLVNNPMPGLTLINLKQTVHSFTSFPSVNMFNIATWYQWVRRAKTMAQSNLDSGLWQALEVWFSPGAHQPVVSERRSSCR